MRTAVVGNVANNAYLLAKGLRQIGVEADSYDQGGGFALACPEWEEGDFGVGADVPATRRPTYSDPFWSWHKVPMRNGWRRPPWARIIGYDEIEGGARPWYGGDDDGLAAFVDDLPDIQSARRCLDAPAALFGALERALDASRTPVHQRAALLDAYRHTTEQTPSWRSLLRIVREGAGGRPYDVAVLCGGYAALGPLLPKEQAWVTFEHATMRYVPMLAEAWHRQLCVAYQQADANVITNADCWEAAGQLGVRGKSVFIPHPLDSARFTPGPAAAHVRQALCERTDGAQLLLLAPARHSRSEKAGSKRNDRIVHALARYVAGAEPAGAPRAGLVFLEWGTPAAVGVEDTRRLVAALGLERRVHWVPCAPKPRLLHLYHAADIVLDQFSDTVGSFGAVTAEAMACGKPVITYYSHEAHEWCADVLPAVPPLHGARTTDALYEQLVLLAERPHLRAETGQRARAWVEQYHSLERVCRLHLALYERVIRERRQHQQHHQAQQEQQETAAHALTIVQTDVGPVGIGPAPVGVGA